MARTKEQQKKNAAPAPSPAQLGARSGALHGVLIRPRITEKATVLGEQNVYTFDVAPSSNKMLVAKAITALYKVKPMKVRVVAVPRKKIFVRGTWGTRGGGKKALVYLKKGEKIEFV
ncbi:MAG: 50S ribosomal protein L23 [bacterium]|nr:50S ribosomal protein L23 [bacterium]